MTAILNSLSGKSYNYIPLESISGDFFLCLEHLCLMLHLCWLYLFFYHETKQAPLHWLASEEMTSTQQPSQRLWEPLPTLSTPREKLAALVFVRWLCGETGGSLRRQPSMLPFLFPSCPTGGLILAPRLSGQNSVLWVALSENLGSWHVNKPLSSLRRC